MARQGLRSRHWPIPTRVLLALASSVLLAHLLALHNVALRLGAPETISTRVFSTRSITIAQPPPPAPTPPARPVAAKPPPPPPAPKPARPKTEGVMAATAPVVEAAASEPAAAVEPPTETVAQIPLPVPPEPAPPEEPRPAQSPEPASLENLLGTPSASGRFSGAAAPLTSDTASAGRPFVVPGSIRLNFDATGKRGRFDYKAMGTLTWLQDGSGYDMKLEMGDWILGKRVLSSTGKLGAEGLAPTRFSDKFRSERAAHFDRKQHRITFSANTPQATLAPGAQDQLSIFAQLASMVAGDPLGFPIGTQVDVQTAGPRDADLWVFVVEREEMLYLPGGQVPALKLVRKPGKQYDQTVELWLAPELAYLPARIRITFANGDYLDQQWRSSSAP